MSVTRVQAIPLTEIDAATISNLSFSAINPNGLPKSCYLLRIINQSNTDVTVSYDNGANSADYVIATQTAQIFAQANSKNGAIGNFPKGLVVSVAGTAGVGHIYLAGYYINSEVGTGA